MSPQGNGGAASQERMRETEAGGQASFVIAWRDEDGDGIHENYEVYVAGTRLGDMGSIAGVDRTVDAAVDAVVEAADTDNIVAVVALDVVVAVAAIECVEFAQERHSMKYLASWSSMQSQALEAEDMKLEQTT